LKPRSRVASLSARKVRAAAAAADADVAQQHRQQDQVREDQHRDAQAGGQRQVLDDRDVDHHQHREAHRVGEECGHAGQEQAPEREARRHQPVCAGRDVLHDAVHLLRTVADADGEHEERHQDRIRVELEAEARHQPQLPDHGHQRAGHHQRGRAHAAGVQPDDAGGDRRGEAEVEGDLHQAVDQVADQLGEADHVHARRTVGFDPVADFLDRVRQRAVIEALAGGRVGVEQRHHQHAGLEVVADQAADDVGARDVAAQLLGGGGRAVVVVRHHRAAAEAFFGDLGPAHPRRPQRLHPGPVDTRRQEDLVVDLLERGLVGRVVDVAFRVLDHDAQRVAQTAQFTAVLQVVLDVRVAARDHLLEARAQRQPGRREQAQHQREDRADRDDDAPVVEDQPLEARAGLGSKLSRLPRVGRSCGGAACMSCLRMWGYCSACAATPRGPPTTTPLLAVASTAAAGTGRSTLASLKEAPSSLLTSTCPA
jgi:hypothetical protein